MTSKESIAETIKFYTLCEVMETIAKEKTSSSKPKILSRYLQDLQKHSEHFRKENPNADWSLYCVLRCLIPQRDNARDSYNMKITTIGNILVKILNLSPNGEDAGKLQNKTGFHRGKDYAEIAYGVLKGRVNENPSNLTLANIHKLLDILAESDRTKITFELTRFLQKTCAIEQKWLIRLILKNMHLGISEQLIFTTFHPQAKEHFLRHSSLQKTCESVARGENLEVGGSIVPFMHIRPMLCEKLLMRKLEDIFKTDTYFMETKMDGERFQIHMADEEYKYLSRDGHDYTTSFGRNVSTGNLTPLLAKLFKVNVKNIIMDGELMVWDKSTASYRVKGENIIVRNLQTGGNLRPCFVVFDVLYLNDVSYLNSPYIERISLLHKILKEQAGVLMFCKQTKIQNVEHFMKCFNEAIEANEEGLVFKSQTGVYKPGSRANGWYKIKPDYIDNIVCDLDLLIIGVYCDKSRKHISGYLVGVCEKIDDNEIPTFHVVGSVHQGLSHQERRTINDEILKHLLDSPEPPDFVRCGRTKPNAWVDPKQSIILQIKASELAPSTSFAVPYCLRFPRIEAIRSDKLWHECTPLQEYESFYEGISGVKKVTKRALTLQDLQDSKRLKLQNGSKSTANPYASTFEPNLVNKVTDAFSGLSVCILTKTGYGKFSQKDLSEMVVKHGGKIILNPFPNSKDCICVANEMTIRVKKLKEKGLYNIVHIDWLIRAFSGDTVTPSLAQPKPRDMICTTADMKEEFQKYFDVYGDSYTDHVDDQELTLLLSELKSENLTPLQNTEMESLENKLFEDANPNFFRTSYAYFYTSKDITNLMTLAKLIFQSRGGSILHYEAPDERKVINYIFIDSSHDNLHDFKRFLKQYFEKRLNKVKVVSIKWIFDCDKENKKLGLESNYLIPL